jgi:hypothetical protein
VESDAGADGGADAGDDGALENICRQALVCGLPDPWMAPPTTYSLSYESGLPNTSSGDGRFVPAGDPANVTGLLELHSGISFCQRGTLGLDDIGGARDTDACLPPALEAGDVGSQKPSGDRVVIAPEILSDRALVALGRSQAERDRCGKLRTALDEDDTAVLAFEIIAAFEDRVAIRSRLDEPFDRGELSFDWPGLQTCIGEGLVRFFVRSHDGFIVQTSRDGFQHNVIANANGRCVVDAMSEPRFSHRTWTGCEYRDDRIQFVLEPFVVKGENAVVKEPGDGDGVIVQLGLTTTAQQLVMNAAQIGFGITTLVPSRLRWNNEDEHLYMVDTYQGGLIPIELDPFSDSPITSFY